MCQCSPTTLFTTSHQRAINRRPSQEEFRWCPLGDVKRYELPALNGFNFVMDQALEGGVNESLNLDGHGKSWSFMLLGLTVELEH